MIADFYIFVIESAIIFSDNLIFHEVQETSLLVPAFLASRISVFCTDNSVNPN